MFIATNVDIAAWSPDGGSALVLRSESGPEGGGRQVWLVINAAGASTYTLSSTMSPGDGSTPETISTAACRTAATDLARRLVSFDGVKVHADRCAGKRDAIVEVDTERQEQVKRSWNPEGTKVTCRFKKLRVTRDEVEVEVVKTDDRCPKDLAWASVGPLVLVVGRDETQSALIGAVVQTKAEFFTIELGM